MANSEGKYKKLVEKVVNEAINQNKIYSRQQERHRKKSVDTRLKQVQKFNYLPMCDRELQRRFSESCFPETKQCIKTEHFNRNKA